MTTIAQIKAANKAAGYHFFDKDTMRFFQSRIVSRAYKGRLFITAERADPLCPYKYTLRQAHVSGDIATIGRFQAFNTIVDARRVARNISRMWFL